MINDTNNLKTEIASTAIVSSKAHLDSGTRVGVGAVIGDKVTIGKNVNIGSYVIMEGRTTVGDNCTIFPHAVIGTAPQDLKYSNEDTELFIGDGTVIREFATVNLGTIQGHRKTVIGKNNFLMAYSHVAHDCILGDNIIIANAATLAGHIEVHDYAIIGGLAAIHQFVRIGKFAFVGGCSGVSQDVLPFSRVAGNHAMTYSVNSVGLQRAGFTKEFILLMKKVFRLLFSSRLTRKEALDTISKEYSYREEITYFLSFIKSSQRGICKKAR